MDFRPGSFLQGHEFRTTTTKFRVSLKYKSLERSKPTSVSVSTSPGVVGNLTGNTRLGQTGILGDHTLPVPEGYPRPVDRGEQVDDLLVLPHLKEDRERRRLNRALTLVTVVFVVFITTQEFHGGALSWTIWPEELQLLERKKREILSQKPYLWNSLQRPVL